MELAKSLITAMTKEIDLASYQDEYRKAWCWNLSLPSRKGRSIDLPAVLKAASTDVVDALLASLKAVGAEAR